MIFIVIALNGCKEAPLQGVDVNEEQEVSGESRTLAQECDELVDQLKAKYEVAVCSSNVPALRSWYYGQLDILGKIYGKQIVSDHINEQSNTDKEFLAVLVDVLERGYSYDAVEKDMANFEMAMENISTAPSYVLVAIVDKKAGKSWGVCMESMELLSAIMKEHDIQNPDVYKKAVEIIKQNNSKIFTFTKPDALKYLKPVYTREILKKIRSEFSYYTDEELAKLFSKNRTRNMQSLCKQFNESHRVTQTATAHMLLERGILCGRGCLGGYLYIDKR